MNFVREHRGNQPHEVLPALLMFEERVAALCGARGIPRPSVTYLGTYGEHTKFCRIPITRSTGGVRIWWDQGWYAAMQGLRAEIAERTLPKQPDAGHVERIDAQTRQKKIAELTPAARKAYCSFQFAELKAGKQLKDWEAYELLKEEGIPEGSQGELTDYRLPAVDTWSRHLRKARQELSEQKYTSRQGRQHGKSVVKRDQIE